MSSILKVDTLQDTGANTILASDGSGNLTTQKILYPAFFAYSTSEQSVTTGAETKVQFANEEFDTNSAFDSATNYRFTVPSGNAGKYYFYANIVGRSTSNDIVYVIIQLRKNGSTYIGNRVNTNSTTQASFRDFGVSVSAILDLSVGDYVEVYGRVSATSPLIADGNAKETHFGGYRIGD